MGPRRRFRFLQELAEGAFGKVYLAEMITADDFSSIVAIKLLHGKWLDHDEIVQRSRDEARVLGLLHHRNIIRVEDLTSINGQCAIVMEYLDGVDLKTLIRFCESREMRFPRRVVCEVGAQIASALNAAYYAKPLQGGEPLKVIHRDIKPSNVMLTEAGDVKVLDFGTAQASFCGREAHTQQLAFGSAAYMSPERLLGDPDHPSGDVFSLGVTLYEMFAGKTFGKVQIRPEKFETHLSEAMANVDLGRLEEEAEQTVRALLRSLLAYNPSDRPHVRDVIDQLEAVAEGIHDMTIRRFCREVVKPCNELIEPPVAGESSLQGSTLFEDSSNLVEADNAPEVVVGPPDKPELLPVRSLPTDPGLEGGVQGPGQGVPDLGVSTGGEALPAKPGKGLFIAGVLIGLLAVGGGGFFLVSQPDPETALNGGVVTPTPSGAQPGGTYPQGEPGPDVGTLKLSLSGNGGALVTLTQPVGDPRGYKFVWDGTGNVELGQMQAGRYRSRVVQGEEVAIRNTVDVQAGMSCVYSMDLRSGEEEWQSTGCSPL